jgi:hypothetical protein
MKVGNAYVTGSLCCDAATHPDYQGKGVFSSIVNRSYLDAAERGIPITYGFARTNVGPIYKRYERAGHICYMKRMVKVLDWERILARHLHNKLLTGAAGYVLRRIRRSRSRRPSLSMERVSRFDNSIDSFWKQVSNDFRIIVRRDQRYLNWRYPDHPDKEYTIYTAVRNHEILGYCVLSQAQWRGLKLGLIVDILGVRDQRNVVACLVDEAVELLGQQGVQGIAAAMSEEHPYTALFRRAGFVTYPSRSAVLHAAINLPGSPIHEEYVYDQANLLSQNSLLRKKSNWFMAYGDTNWCL